VNPSFERFLRLPPGEQADVFTAGAQRIGTIPSYVEKDFWVCFVLEALYHGLPAGHPKLLFKGGTSLSKPFGLIRRFSEDIDIVVFRNDLGFSGERDPANREANLSRKKRETLFDELRAACSAYIQGDLRGALDAALRTIGARGTIVIDEDDKDGQTLLVEYPSVFDASGPSYVSPRVRIEGGARSALDPHAATIISPFIAGDLPDWSFDITGITTIGPDRTFWEKLLILHGAHCGYRDEQRLPSDRDRLSRHYYDVAMIGDTAVGRKALGDHALATAVREHNLLAFRQAWKKFEEAVPGSLRIVPQAELCREIERDYAAMQGMILGDAPPFEWIMERLAAIEAVVNPG
jgi:hypothetical protein